MIRIIDEPLSQEATDQLRRFQQAIDVIADYEAKVQAAKRQFTTRNRRGKRTFDEVKDVLTRMCSGARRCMYCEDSRADEVEHIYPKDLYPDKTFDWENYLYICGPCNVAKNNQFEIFDQHGKRHNITRKPGDPIVPPIAGTAILINPRLEDAMQYLILDIRGTFKFQPHYRLKKDSRDHIRAMMTRSILDLDRADLVEERRNNYDSYVARLEQYVTRRERGARFSELQRLQTALLRLGHPTVWKEMQRQAEKPVSELHDLFVRANAFRW